MTKYQKRKATQDYTKRSPRTRSLGNPRSRRRVIQAVRRGHNREDAAALAGVTYRTLLNEMQRDEGFAELVEKAKLSCKARMVSVVKKGALDDPKLAMSWLERNYPQEWSRSGNVIHEGIVDHNIRLSVDEQRAELTDLITALRQRAGTNGHPPVASNGNGNGQHHEHN